MRPAADQSAGLTGRPRHRARRVRASAGWFAAALVSCASGGAAADTIAAANWDGFEGDADAAHFSPLAQIDRTNVARLEIVWTRPSGGSFATPTIVDGTMYLLGEGAVVEAVDAATGRRLWSGPAAHAASRGLTYWQDDQGRDRRLFFATGGHLHAIDADTGERVHGFGIDGRIDLRIGLERDPRSLTRIESTTPGRVFGELIILGSATGEDYGSPPGDIRAYDVRSGRFAWQFHTIPRAREAGSSTWPGPDPRRTHGGANAWGGSVSVDEARGIAYVALGSATYDFWGGDRCGDNLYANSIVALDARTGALRWHFQTVHHDLWDYDLSSSPVLLAVQHEGRRIDAVAVAGKTGFLYAFERETGRPLWPIDERAVPQHGADDECPSATQPFPTRPAPFALQRFTVDDIDPALPATLRTELVQRLAAARNDGLFTPPSATRETVMMPGSFGGANWGAVAAWPDRGRVYVVGRNLPGLVRLSKGVANVGEALVAHGKPPYELGEAIYRGKCAGCHARDRSGRPPTIPALHDVVPRLGVAALAAIIERGRGSMPGFPGLEGAMLNGLTAYLAGDRLAGPHEYSEPERSGRIDRWHSAYGLLDNEDGASVVAGAKSTLTAYDLNRGEIEWQVPLPDAVAPSTTLVTGGGLVFVGAGRERSLRVLDAVTGALLWSHPLRVGAYGVPATYAVDGRQFVVVPTSTGIGTGRVPGSWKPRELDFADSASHSGTTGESSGEYVVFALPRR
jgi:quinoprotein glucose dehydrogenase